ncbi:Ig-like domain-containing protein [Deltaproteobacteria bacterium]|nr:Ig-like domain-containing protein [Deltaproteobacteria bacterium]
MQDTRTVILNMDFHKRSSSRSSPSVSASELSQYKTHLILALPSLEYLSSSYKNFFSSFAQELMNPDDKKVSLEIPLNTQMKIFAFLFKENYSMSKLFSGVREVGYYGESRSFSINTNTNSLSLGITLKAASGNEDDSTGTGAGTGDTTAPTSSVTTATITNSGNTVVQSTETGTAYLVNTAVTVSNLASITGAVDSQWNSVAISSANTNTNLAATGLVDGTYKVYAVDAAGNLSSASTNSVTLDTTAPTLAETTLVPSLTNDNSTQYTFSSSEGGTISIGGSCSSDNNTALADNMTVSFAALADGTYSDCTITVTDSAGNTQTISVNTFTIDSVKPVLAQVIAVTTPTNDNTSSYTFSSTEAGTISYSICGGNLDNASEDNNTITFDALADETYSNCKISVTDNASNTSDNLSVSSFTIDTVKPVLRLVTAVTTPTNVTTPSYVFSSDEAGTITYGGSCGSSTTSATSGDNTVILTQTDNSTALSEAQYADCSIKVTDNATNQSNTLAVSSFTIDITASTVTSVSSSNSNGAYNENDNVTITITFSESVIVDNSSGNPRIQLETGTNDRYANYVSGNSTSILSFLYTAQSGDNSSDLDYTSTSSLSANNGTIRDNATNNANLTLLAPGSSGSLGANKAIVIDTTAPTVSSISPTDNQSSVSVSDNISLTFSEIINNSSITTNTDNTSCYGSFQVSSDNFSTCVQMSSSPSISNSAKTFTFDPSDNLSYDNKYKIKLTTDTKDENGVSLESPYETSFNTFDNSLVAYYPFNGNAKDLTSNGRDFTVYVDLSPGDATLTNDKDNSSNSAYSFDGNGDYLEYTANIPSFDNYTISLWAKPDSSGTYKAMFSSYNNAGNGFQIDLESNRFHIRKASSSGGNILLSTAELGDWTFIAFTYDGTNSIGYINDNITVSDPGGTTEFNRFRIGRNRSGSTFFSGAIDELRIYNRALTASEISGRFAN